MKALLQINDVAFDKLTKENWDNLIIIDGDAGKGKSNLALHLMHDWYARFGKVTDELIEFNCLDGAQFVRGLNKLKRYGMIVYDEAGELSNLRQMNKFNYRITLAYQIIRGRNLYTILILPNVFRLNPYFVLDRARCLIHVKERRKNHCRVSVWDKQRLKKMISLNQSRKVKNYWVTTPLFRDYYMEYKGTLRPAYDKKKEEKLKSITAQLEKELVVIEKTDEMLEALKRSKELIGVTKTAKVFGVNKTTVYNRLKAANGE